MKKYNQPQLEIYSVDAEDVIATSGLKADLSPSFDAAGRDLF